MNMKIVDIKKITVLFTVLFLILSVGCNEAVKDELVEVSFSSCGECADDENARMAISMELNPAYKPELLFWTYTAEKLDGLYATGLCKTATKVSDNAGDGIGLSGFPKRFSVGKWKFTVKGYSEKAHTNLVYSSTQEVTLEASTTKKTIVFELKNEAKAPAANSAVIKIQDLSITLPPKTTFALNSNVKLTIKDTTANKTLVNGIVTPVVSRAVDTGKNIALNCTVANNTGLAAGNHVLSIQIDYDNDGSGTVYGYSKIMVGKLNVKLQNGTTTLLAGDIRDYVTRIFPIGGVVYYIHPDSFPMTNGSKSETIYGNQNGQVTVGGFTYTFYNSSGEPVDLRNGTSNSSYQIEYCDVPFGGSNNLPLVVGKPTSATLPTATASVINRINNKAGKDGYYSVSGTPTCDRFFVCRNVKYGGVGYANPSVVLPAINAVDVGSGKAATALAMNSANKSKTMVKITGGAWSSTCYGIMCWVDYVNNGTAYSGATFASNTPTRQFDCSDWYVPSVMELEAMFRSNLFTGSVSGCGAIFASGSPIMSACTYGYTASLGRINTYAYISEHPTTGQWYGTLIRSF